MSLVLAVTALQKIQAVPAHVWVNIALGIGGFILAVVLIRRAAQMNKIVLTIIILVVLAVFGLQWVYERNEPRFLTPFVDKIAPFFPSKADYGARQQGQPPVR